MCSDGLERFYLHIRCALSALASLQPDQAAFVLTALANDPARLHQPASGMTASSSTQNGSALEELAGTDMSGVAGAIMVFEQVIRVRTPPSSEHIKHVFHLSVGSNSQRAICRTVQNSSMCYFAACCF